MLIYTGKRLLMLIPVIIGITFILYMIMSLSPGDPVALLLGADASAEQLASKREELGLDKPVVLQYLNYISGVVFRGDFGSSWLNGYNVLSEFSYRLPYTLLVGVLATLLAVGAGIPLGILSAIKQNQPFDYSNMVLAMLLFSLPAFWLGIMCQILFCLVLNWLPAAGVGSWRHFVLPSIVLGANIFASMIRMSRTSMLDVIRQDYVRTARAKGATERRVIMNHALRNGLMPVITQIGLSFAACVGGAVVTETIFSIPGVGALLINAVKSRDIPVVMGVLIFVSAIVGIINLLVDLICARIDPRIDLAS